MTTSSPTRSREEIREDALAKANRVKRRRTEIKQEILSGETTLYDLLVAPPTAILTLRVDELLRWVPGIAKSRSKQIVKKTCGHGVEPRVGELSAEQREALIEHVKHYQPTKWHRHTMESF